MTEQLAIDAAALTKSFGQVAVLKGVDLAVAEGEVCALLGPNGAGKTTMIRILATLISADGGRARVAGHDVHRERREVRRRISLTGQYAAVDELQTGLENLAMMGDLRGLSRRESRARAAALLADFDLTESGNRRVATYSGGMRRRLDLAAGLVTQPEVLFLDEPTTGLDPRSRQAMWDVVAGLAKSGVTVLLTTQYLEEADRLAQRIAVIDGGKIVASGTAEELKRQVAGRRLDIRLADAASFDDAVTYLADRAVHRDRDLLTLGVATEGDATQIRSFLDEVDPGRSRISEFSVSRTSLDDVFMALTGKQAAGTNQQSETADV